MISESNVFLLFIQYFYMDHSVKKFWFKNWIANLNMGCIFIWNSTSRLSAEQRKNYFSHDRGSTSFETFLLIFFLVRDFYSFERVFLCFFFLFQLCFFKDNLLNLLKPFEELNVGLCLMDCGCLKHYFQTMLCQSWSIQTNVASEVFWPARLREMNEQKQAGFLVWSGKNNFFLAFYSFLFIW